MSSVLRQEVGEVVATAGMSAEVRVERSGGCSSCANEATCGMYGKAEMIVTASNPLGARPGQKVRISMKTVGAIKASFILYLVPLAGLLVGMFVGRSTSVFGSRDASAAVCSLAFMALAFVGLRIYGHLKYDRDSSYIPEISAVLGGE